MLRKNIQATAGRTYPHTPVMKGKFAAESKTVFDPGYKHVISHSATAVCKTALL